MQSVHTFLVPLKASNQFSVKGMLTRNTARGFCLHSLSAPRRITSRNRSAPPLPHLLPEVNPQLSTAQCPLTNLEAGEDLTGLSKLSARSLTQGASVTFQGEARQEKETHARNCPLRLEPWNVLKPKDSNSTTALHRRYILEAYWMHCHPVDLRHLKEDRRDPA